MAGEAEPWEQSLDSDSGRDAACDFTLALLSSLVSRLAMCTTMLNVDPQTPVWWGQGGGGGFIESIGSGRLGGNPGFLS